MRPSDATGHQLFVHTRGNGRDRQTTPPSYTTARGVAGNADITIFLMLPDLRRRVEKVLFGGRRGRGPQGSSGERWW